MSKESKNARDGFAVIAVIILICGLVYLVFRPGGPMGPLCDCAWGGGTVKAWVDEDKDKVWDEDEKPLPGVMFHVSGGGGLSPEMTDAEGEAFFEDVWAPGCDCSGLKLSAEPPPGFRSTTKSRIVVGTGRDAPLLFGFTYSWLEPTSTPKPVITTCIPGKVVPKGEFMPIWDIEVASNGDVWVATPNDGVLRYDPQMDEWTTYLGELANQVPVSITITDNDDIWIGTEGEAVLFDGSSWTFYSRQYGLAGYNAHDIEVAPDGIVWFATESGITRFDPAAGTRKKYPNNPAWEAPYWGDYATDIAIGPDGSLWCSSYKGVLSRLVLQDVPEDSYEWEDYSYNKVAAQDSRTIPVLARTIEVAEDGTFWLAGFDGVAHFDPATGESTHYDLNTKHQPELGRYTEALTIAPDGSIWVGTSDYGVIQLFPAEDEGTDTRFLIYNIVDGLPDNHIQSIDVAPDGTIWVGTGRGVSRCVVEAR